jgi:hypothetical protein
MFRSCRDRHAKDFTILENNAIAVDRDRAGYMTGPLISGIAAYMWMRTSSSLVADLLVHGRARRSWACSSPSR